MADKIESLTAEQTLRLTAYRAEAYRAGTSCAPADRPRAEAAFARAYATIGRRPVPVVWVDSPLTASLAFAALKHPSSKETADSLWKKLGERLRHSLEQSLWQSLRQSLRESLEQSLGQSLLESLEQSLGQSLRQSLGQSLEQSLEQSLGQSLEQSLEQSLGQSLRQSLWQSLGQSLEQSLGQSLRESLEQSLGQSLRESLGPSLASLRQSLRQSLGQSRVEPQWTYWWGQQDLYWIAFYMFCAEIGVNYQPKPADKLDIMHEISMSCMWWYPRDGVIIACERPLALRVDERERLHNTEGPAIEFRDGWKIYAVHGARVPAWIVEDPARLTIDSIHAEPNSEIQRVMIERFGWDRYANECGAEVIDDDEQWGTLLRRKTRGDPVLFLRVVNGSPEPDGSFRNYILPVAPRCEPLPDPADPHGELGEPQRLTALNAVASTYGMRGEEYEALSVRT